MTVPRSHPRFESLRIREMLVAGFDAGAVAPEGLVAHGRGEAFDYMLGERTIPAAGAAARAAAALLLISSNPVVSVNGNVAALCAAEASRLAAASGAKVEVNLFYDSRARRRIISGMLRRNGSGEVLGTDESRVELPGLESARRMVSARGISAADTVLVMLEDGDRAGALKAAGKRVIAIDLNPLSRTARAADITIIDNVTRALPLMIKYCNEMSRYDTDALRLAAGFDNQANLAECESCIRGGGRVA